MSQSRNRLPDTRVTKNDEINMEIPKSTLEVTENSQRT